ncbi:TPA: RNA polymerase sigma factor [Candidatus Poribacteria bacterium]|nr:RNA polymerase sigma factor [Candidatus Poribacteria bacterium]
MKCLNIAEPSVEDAKDLTQEAFVKAFTSLNSFDLNQRFLPWLRKITTNLCISWLRKQKRYCQTAESNDNATLKIVDPSPTPDVMVERKDLHDALNDAVRQLPAKYRAVVVLCYFEGLTYKEIAATLDISVAAVEMRFQAFIAPKNHPDEKLPAQLPKTPPSLANSHIISRTRVQEFVNFPATIPLWLNPGYLLQEIRYIKNHSALHLIYTNGIDSISLFEGPMGGETQGGDTNIMSIRDFREYLAYNTQRSNSLLAWQYDGVGFALVSSERLPRLMRLVEEIQKQMPEVISGENRRLSS